MIAGIGTKPIKTARLKLRRFKREDALMMYHNWANDDRVTQYLSWKTHESSKVTQEIVDGWVRSSHYPYYFHWAIEWLENHQVIGSVSLLNVHPQEGCGEIGYCLGYAYWGKGIMTEACAAVLEFCFQRARFKRVEAKYDILNPGSGQVMRKCGMEYWKTEEAPLEIKNTAFTCDFYSINREQWEAHTGKKASR